MDAFEDHLFNYITPTTKLFLLIQLENLSNGIQVCKPSATCLRLFFAVFVRTPGTLIRFRMIRFSSSTNIGLKNFPENFIFLDVRSNGRESSSSSISSFFRGPCRMHQIQADLPWILPAGYNGRQSHPWELFSPLHFRGFVLPETSRIPNWIIKIQLQNILQTTNLFELLLLALEIVCWSRELSLNF